MNITGIVSYGCIEYCFFSSICSIMSVSCSIGLTIIYHMFTKIQQVELVGLTIMWSIICSYSCHNYTARKHSDEMCKCDVENEVRLDLQKSTEN